MAKEEEDFTLFGQEEREMLKYSIGIRKKMVDDKVNEGIFGNGDMRVVSEVLNGLDTSLLALAKLDQDESKNKDDAEVKHEMVAIMSARRRERPRLQDRNTSVPDDAFDGEILHTEIAESGEVLEPSDFLEEME